MAVYKRKKGLATLLRYALPRLLSSW